VSGDRYFFKEIFNIKTKYILPRDLFIFFLVVILGVFFWRNNIATTAVFLGCYLVRYLLWPNKEDHVIFVAGAILGSTAEIIATHVGVWSYRLPTFFNIPVWLPFAWGFATVLIVRIAQSVKR
jgi:hypothetical protein